MGSTKVVGASLIKEGSFIIIEGSACKVIGAETSKSGKHCHAKARIVAVGLIDNKKREIVLPGHDNVEVPIIEKKSAQVLSVSGDVANVMDDESFETIDLKIPEELKDTVVSGVKIIYWIILDEKVMKQIKGGSE